MTEAEKLAVFLRMLHGREVYAYTRQGYLTVDGTISVSSKEMDWLDTELGGNDE